MLNMKAKYNLGDLGKQNFYYIFTLICREELVRALTISNIGTKTINFRKIILFQFVVLMTLDRQKTDMYSFCIGSALVSRNYWSHVTSTL